MIMLFILFFALLFHLPIIAVTPEFEELRLQLTPAQQELFLNNGLNRGILDAPKDRNQPLYHEWHYVFRTYSEFSTRQYTGFTLIDSMFLVPTQPHFIDGLDAQSAPILDSVSVRAFTRFTTRGIKIGKCSVSSTIEGFFGGLIYVGALYSVWNAFINFGWENTDLVIGQARHPCIVEQVDPNLVALNWGSPITPNFGISPQVSVKHRWSKELETICTLYSQNLITDNGPYSFIPDYIRWGMLPGINFKFNVTDDAAWWGVSINFKRIRPRLITNNNLVNLSDNASPVLIFEPPVLAPDYIPATQELLNSTIGSVYCVLQRDRLISKNQILYGNNGVELFTFGGYGVTAFETFPNQGSGPQPTYRWTYANIPFISLFNDTELSEPYCGIQPGIFIGFAKPLPMGTDLKRNPTTGRFEIFTIDDVFQSNERITNEGAIPERVFSLWRLSPRCWVTIAERFKFGTELTILSALYGEPNERYQPITPHRVTMMRLTLCADFGF